jgi:hypothetical protein
MIARIAVALVALLVLAGCSSPAIEPLEPTPTPRPTAEGSGDIGISSATLPPVVDVVAPVQVQVPDVAIDVPILPVGIASDGQMELPADVAIAGWYRYGPAPGSAAGTTVVAAHVDSLEYGLGPFSALDGAPAGTRIVVTSADGTAHEYAIESVQKVPKAELPLDAVFDRAGLPRLVLITCGGQFDYSALTYSDNVVVVATPVVP